MTLRDVRRSRFTRSAVNIDFGTQSGSTSKQPCFRMWQNDKSLCFSPLRSWKRPHAYCCLKKGYKVVMDSIHRRECWITSWYHEIMTGAPENCCWQTLILLSNADQSGLWHCFHTEILFASLGKVAVIRQTDKLDHPPSALHNPKIMDCSATTTTCLCLMVVTGCTDSLFTTCCRCKGFWLVWPPHTGSSAGHAFHGQVSKWRGLCCAQKVILSIKTKWNKIVSVRERGLSNTDLPLAMIKIQSTICGRNKLLLHQSWT